MASKVRLLALATSAALVATTSSSHAADYLTPGVSFSVKICCGPSVTLGFGPAVNYAHWFPGQSSGKEFATLGAFAWFHYYPSLSAARLGLGPQASYSAFGGEFGPSVFFRSQEAISMQASLTPFVSVGYAWIGLRVNFGAQSNNPFAEFVFGGGLPFRLDDGPLGGPLSSGIFGSGRPIRIRGRQRISGTRHDSDYATRLHPSLPSSALQRRTLAKDWRRDAELEYSSIAAFEQLATQLEVLGAPAQLIDRCHRAARDESKHARLCYGLASAYGMRGMGPVPLVLNDLARSHARSNIVYETILDGCYGEALAAANARHRLSEESDPVVRKVLRAIVRDESSHARLAWSIVAWANDGPSTAAALRTIALLRYDNPLQARVARKVARGLREQLTRCVPRLAAA